jgi:hypothetical protein
MITQCGSLTAEQASSESRLRACNLEGISINQRTRGWLLPKFNISSEELTNTANVEMG